MNLGISLLRFLRNLRAGLRAALLLRVGAHRLSSSPGQLIALVVAGILVQGVSAALVAGGEGGFNFDALPRALVYVPLLLFAVWVISRRRGARRFRLDVAILFCSVSLIVDVAFELLDALDEAGWPWLGAMIDPEVWSERLWYAFYIWWLLAVLVGVASLLDGHFIARLGRAAALLAIVALPAWFMPNVPLWQTEAVAVADETPSTVSREDVFYAQPALLDDALERLESERPGTPDIYFVGVAGFAAEDVFMKELDVVGALFRERFDTANRMIALVNNPRTVSDIPLATVTGLQRVLEEIGGIVNVEEDMVFLYLTSHGSEDHRVAMQFAPLQLRDIEPKLLRKMLDDSGIKWRIIVISACFSGGFIEALQDDHTLVITASDADHESFGCGSESDFTYFGRAYFDQALRTTTSFTDAFVRAKASIANLERSQQLTPSNPQMSVGAKIEAKLREVDERLSKQPKGLPVRAPSKVVRLDAATALVR